MEYKSDGAISENDLYHGHCLTEEKHELHVAFKSLINDQRGCGTFDLKAAF